MNLTDIIKKVMTNSNLRISQCQQVVNAGDCQWDCCIYSDSYCLMLPGEYEAAIALGYSVSGYRIIDDDYFGGKKVVPTSMKCCVGPEMPENHYKTLDCWFYPVWPRVSNNDIEMIVGALCPLKLAANESILSHARLVETYVQLLISDRRIHYFLTHAEMVGYNKLEYKP